MPKVNPVNLALTKGSDWRRPRVEGFLIELPSGNVARIRPLPLDYFLKHGKINDMLTPIIMAALEGREEQMPEIRTLDEAKANISLLEDICRLAFIEPRIVDEPTGEDEISIDDLTIDDKSAMMQILGRPAKELESFRFQQGADVEPVVASETHGNESQ